MAPGPQLSALPNATAALAMLASSRWVHRCGPARGMAFVRSVRVPVASNEELSFFTSRSAFLPKAGR
jgi:hypothetical protein